MEYKIEKGVPVPPIKYLGRTSKYPFTSMGVGDSFFCDEKVRRVSNAARAAGTRHNMKFCLRKENDGCRVWRIE